MIDDQRPDERPAQNPAQGLLANAQRVLALAESVRDAKSVALKSDKFSERKQHVQDLLGRLAPLAATQRALVEAAIPFPGSPHGAGTYTTTADQFEAVTSTFRDDPDSLFGTPFKEVKDRAYNIATGLERRLREGWAAHVESVVQTPAGDQLDVFAKVPDFRDVAVRLKALYASRAALAERLPTNAEEVQAPHDLAAQIEEAWRALGGDAPASVLDLLRAAGTPSGASLDTLTDDVRRWISDNNLSDTLRIRLTS